MNSNCVRLNYLVEEEFEDTTGIIRRRKSKKDRTCNDEQEKNKRNSTVYIILHRKLKIEQHETQ